MGIPILVRQHLYIGKTSTLNSLASCLQMDILGVMIRVKIETFWVVVWNNILVLGGKYIALWILYFVNGITSSWRGWFNKKMPSYQYRKSHCGDKTILWPSYLHNGISYTGKTASVYWIRALIFVLGNPSSTVPPCIFNPSLVGTVSANICKENAPFLYWTFKNVQHHVLKIGCLHRLLWEHLLSQSSTGVCIR